jgi:predicted metalloprotease with PDZ domain
VRDGDEPRALAEALSAVGLTLTISDGPPHTVAGFAADRDGTALRVVALSDGGPAAIAGLKPGDRITQLDGAVPSARWSETIARRPAGAALVLVGTRAGRPIELHLTLRQERDLACKLAATAASPAATRLREALLSP